LINIPASITGNLWIWSKIYVLG